MKRELLLIALLLLPVAAHSEEAQPKEFFDKGFAETPLDKDGARRGSRDRFMLDQEQDTSEVVPKSKHSSDSSGENLLKKGVQKNEINEEIKELGAEAGAEEKESADENTASLGLEGGVPIKTVSMIVDGSDEAGFFENLRNFSDFIIEHNIQPRTVYVVGMFPLQPDVPHDWMKIVARGGKITMDPKVTERYQVTLSPTWIVETSQGEVVLEAVDSLQRYINGKGEFKREFLEN